MVSPHGRTPLGVLGRELTQEKREEPTMRDGTRVVFRSKERPTPIFEPLHAAFLGIFYRSPTTVMILLSELRRSRSLGMHRFPSSDSGARNGLDPFTCAALSSLSANSLGATLPAEMHDVRRPKRLLRHGTKDVRPLMWMSVYVNPSRLGGLLLGRCPDRLLPASGVTLETGSGNLAGR